MLRVSAYIKKSLYIALLVVSSVTLSPLAQAWGPSVYAGPTRNMTLLDLPAADSLNTMLKMELPGFLDQPGDDETWLDGDLIRYYTDPMRAKLDPKYYPILDELYGVQIRKQADGVLVNVVYSREMVVKIADKNSVGNGKVYEVTLPKNTVFRASLTDGVLRVQEAKSGGIVKFKAKIPFLPDNGVLERGEYHIGDGFLQMNARVLGSLVNIVAKGKFVNGQFDGDISWGPNKRLLVFMLPFVPLWGLVIL